MLSLEGVLFVYLAYICLPREVPVSQGLPLAWGLWGLWCGYAVERWLDVSFTSEGVVTWRHRFHRASMGGLLLGAGVWVLFLIKGSPELPLATWNHGATWAWMALGGVVILLPQFYRSFAVWALRAVLMSGLFAFMVNGFNFKGPWEVSVSVGFLAFANLASVRRSELTRPGNFFSWTAPLAMTVGLLTAYVGAASYRWLAFATVWGGFGLWVLERQSAEEDLERYRARVDGITLLALGLSAIAVRLAI